MMFCKNQFDNLRYQFENIKFISHVNYDDGRFLMSKGENFEDQIYESRDSNELFILLIIIYMF